MLVLTRRAKETVIIDNDIKVTVVAVEGDKVRLAIDAPKEITILREEVFQAIKEANKASAGLNLDAKGLSKLKELLP